MSHCPLAYQLQLNFSKWSRGDERITYKLIQDREKNNISDRPEATKIYNLPFVGEVNLVNHHPDPTARASSPSATKQQVILPQLLSLEAKLLHKCNEWGHDKNNVRD